MFCLKQWWSVLHQSLTDYQKKNCSISVCKAAHKTETRVSLMSSGLLHLKSTTKNTPHLHHRYTWPSACGTLVLQLYQLCWRAWISHQENTQNMPCRKKVKNIWLKQTTNVANAPNRDAFCCAHVGRNFTIKCWKKRRNHMQQEHLRGKMPFQAKNNFLLLKDT